ncbi:MAG: hypothetical protein ACI4O8_11825 [Aristaeellaceae bacterium]
MEKFNISSEGRKKPAAADKCRRPPYLLESEAFSERAMLLRPDSRFRAFDRIQLPWIVEIHSVTIIGSGAGTRPSDLYQAAQAAFIM